MRSLREVVTRETDPETVPDVSNGSKAAIRLAAGMGGKRTLGRDMSADHEDGWLTHLDTPEVHEC